MITGTSMLLLHLSDIHFHSDDIRRPDDPNRGLRDDIIQDVREMRRRLQKDTDCILISGDIAFAGKEKEYDFAFEWLVQLCSAAGCDIENIFVVPGNHDVDRNESKSPMHADARIKLRGVAVKDADYEMTRYLRDPASSEMLFRPIHAYNRFAAKFWCDIDAFSDADDEKRPYACRDFDLNDGSVLRLWGFNSVLVCDEHDAKDTMYVDPSAAQVIERSDSVVDIVLCHHPYDWLRNSANFRERVEGVAKLHLFGHEHTRRVDQNIDFTAIRAGAVHPDRDGPEWKPGYNFIEVAVDGSPENRRLEGKIWVRQREGVRFIAVPDRKGIDPWTFSHELPAWQAAAEVDLVEETFEFTSSHGEQAVPGSALNVRSLAVKMLSLREHEQRKIIIELGLDQDGDQSLLDYELALTAIRRAEERGELEALDAAIDAV
ncbi:MAG: metallophosphoesterase [Halioglobus sp.]